MIRFGLAWTTRQLNLNPFLALSVSGDYHIGPKSSKQQSSDQQFLLHDMNAHFVPRMDPIENGSFVKLFWI